MKHIGWCLDQIQIVTSKMPLRLHSSEDKAKAQAIINEVEEYKNTLAEINGSSLATSIDNCSNSLSLTSKISIFKLKAR